MIRIVDGVRGKLHTMSRRAGAEGTRPTSKVYIEVQSVHIHAIDCDITIA